MRCKHCGEEICQTNIVSVNNGDVGSAWAHQIGGLLACRGMTVAEPAEEKVSPHDQVYYGGPKLEEKSQTEKDLEVLRTYKNDPNRPMVVTGVTERFARLILNLYEERDAQFEINEILSGQLEHLRQRIIDQT